MEFKSSSPLEESRMKAPSDSTATRTYSNSDVPLPRRASLWERVKRIMPFIGHRSAKDIDKSCKGKAKIPSKPERVSELDERYKESKKKYGGGWSTPPHLAR